MVALAQTGTGKTAFGFPVIQKIDANNRNTQALILSPTRELCLQITNEIKKLLEIRKGINVIYGASITDQAREIKRGTNYCGDSGRMQDMINRGLVNISQIDFVF
jgi:ATP-dependent RNA helicase DeaD